MRCALIVGLICFFMLGLWLNVPQAILAVDSLLFTKNHQEMSIQCFANFWVFQREFSIRRSCTGTIRRVTWTALRAHCFSAPKRAAGAKAIRRPESRFQRWYFWFPPILGRCPRLVVNCAFGANSQGTATSRLGESGEDTHITVLRPRED